MFTRYFIARIINSSLWRKTFSAFMMLFLLFMLAWVSNKIVESMIDSAYRSGVRDAETRCYKAHGAQLSNLDSSKKTKSMQRNVYTENIDLPKP